MILTTYIILAALTIFSFVYGWREKELKVFTLCGTLAILLCILTLFNQPAENKITSQILSIEPKLKEIEETQKELVYISNELINIIDQLQEQGAIWLDEPKKNPEIEKSIINLQRRLNTTFNRDEKIFERKIYK